VIPSPFGQPGVTFQLSLLTDTWAVFKNPRNEFPSIISYERKDDKLVAKDIGIQDGEPVTMIFNFVKK